MHTDSDVAYMREASAVARSTMEGKPEPQGVERATDTDSSRFLFYLAGPFVESKDLEILL